MSKKIQQAAAIAATFKATGLILCNPDDAAKIGSKTEVWGISGGNVRGDSPDGPDAIHQLRRLRGESTTQHIYDVADKTFIL